MILTKLTIFRSLCKTGKSFEIRKEAHRRSTGEQQKERCLAVSHGATEKLRQQTRLYAKDERLFTVRSFRDHEGETKKLDAKSQTAGAGGH